MKNLEKKIKQKQQFIIPSYPQIFKLSKLKDRHAFFKILDGNKNIQVVDSYKDQLKELFAVKNPSHKPEENFKYGDKDGNWVYYPWLNALVHCLPENDFFMVRTARNKLLITQKEQEMFYNCKVGIAGLSIGSSVAICLVLQGGVKNIRLADFDTLALSNTNRVKAGIQNLGLPKVEICARQIYEINPYANVEVFKEGITEKNIEKFTKGLNILVDEVDDLYTKFELRQQAKKLKIPVVMGADNADMAVVDVERYDKNKDLHFFHGRLKVDKNQLKSLSKFEVGRTIAQLIGLENHTPRMLDSLGQLGKTIISWPQLGGTAQLNGAAIAYCVRKIATKQPVIVNRSIISFDELLDPSYLTAENRKKRKQTIKKFKTIFNL